MWLLQANLAGSAVFYHIQSFATRIQMLDIGVRLGLIGDDFKSLREDWTMLRESLQAANALRNRIVHLELNETYSYEVGGVRIHAAPAHF